MFVENIPLTLITKFKTLSNGNFKKPVNAANSNGRVVILNFKLMAT